MEEKIILGAFAALWLAFAVGWVANIVKLAGLLSDPLSGWFIFRAIAIFVAPIGAVLGYL